MIFNFFTLIIFKGAVLDEQDSTGKTALLISTGEGRERTTEYLIKNGCDIHKRDKLAWSISALSRCRFLQCVLLGKYTQTPPSR